MQFSSLWVLICKIHVMKLRKLLEGNLNFIFRSSKQKGVDYTESGKAFEFLSENSNAVVPHLIN